MKPYLNSIPIAILLVFAIGSTASVVAISAESRLSAHGTTELHSSSVADATQQAKAIEKAGNYLAASNQSFLENNGQIRNQHGKVVSDIKFAIHQGSLNAYFMPDRISYVFTGSAAANSSNKQGIVPSYAAHAERKAMRYRLDVELQGCNPSVQLIGNGRGTSPYNFVNGADQAQSIVAYQYQEILYQNIYKDIDLQFRLTESGLKYDFIVHPGGNPADIRMRYIGATKLALNADQELLVTTPIGEMVEDIPLTYLKSPESGSVYSAQREVIKAHYQVRNNIVSFDLPEYDPSLTLVIDPLISWATYYGSQKPTGGQDEARDVAVDANNNIYVVGDTDSQFFPEDGWFPYGGFHDAFIIKFDPDGNVIWATFYGGEQDDFATSVVVDDQNYPIVTGYTNSINLPVSNGFQMNNNGGYDAFISRFDPTFNFLSWGSYVGGAGDDYGMSIALVGAPKRPTITGYTNSVNTSAANDFPVTGNAAQLNNSGVNDAFVVQLSATTLYYSSFWGGPNDDRGMGITGDREGNIIFCGWAQAFFPMLAAGNPTYDGGTYDGFACRIDQTHNLVWSTYLEPQNVGNRDQRAMDIAYARNDISIPISVREVVIVGYGNGDDATAQYDALLYRLNMAGGGSIGTALTFGGATFNEFGHGISIMDEDFSTGLYNVVITGSAQSADLPVVEPFQRFHYALNQQLGFPNQNPEESFVAKFDGMSWIADPLWASYYGANGLDEGNAVAVDGTGRVIMVGTSNSNNLTLRDEVQQHSGLFNDLDAFVVVVEEKGMFPTFYGGTSAPDAMELVGYNDRIEDLTVDNLGNIYITGFAQSFHEFPLTTGVHQEVPGEGILAPSFTDAFVAKFDANGNLIWSSYFGGELEDVGKGVAVSLDGQSVAITGYTQSESGIATAIQTVHGGGSYDAFLAIFNADQGTVDGWTSYLGGTLEDGGEDIAFDANGDIVITGWTNSRTGIATAGAAKEYIGYYAGPLVQPYDAFVAKYRPGTSALLWATYLGQYWEDVGMGVTIVDGDQIVVTGYTDNHPNPPFNRPVFETYGSVNNFPGGKYDAFLAKYSANGAADWAIMYGSDDDDFGTAITTGSDGNVCSTGITHNLTAATPAFPLFPTSLLPLVPTESFDAFILKYDQFGIRWGANVWTPINGNDEDATGIDFSNNQVLLAGTSNDDNLPNFANGLFPVGNNFSNRDSYVAVFSAQTLIQDAVNGGTYFLGNNGCVHANGIAIDAQDRVVIAGWTNADNFANIDNLHPWAFQPENAGPLNNGHEDGFIAQLEFDLQDLAKNLRRPTMMTQVPSRVTIPMKTLASVPILLRIRYM